MRHLIQLEREDRVAALGERDVRCLHFVSRDSGVVLDLCLGDALRRVDSVVFSREQRQPDGAVVIVRRIASCPHDVTSTRGIC